MKNVLILTLFLLAQLSPLSSQTKEAIVSKQIDEAKQVVNNAKSQLRQAEKVLQEKISALDRTRATWNDIQDDIKAIQQRLSSVENSLQASIAQVNEQIKRYQNRLSQLQKDNASETEIKEAQNYVTAYQNMKKRRLAKNPLTKFKAALERNIAQKEVELKSMKSTLQAAIQTTKAAEDQVNSANNALSDAQVKLAEILGKAPEILADINPPHLQKIVIKKGSNVKYEAEWADYTEIIDRQIGLVKNGIIEQKSHLEQLKSMVILISDELIEVNQDAQTKMDAYVGEVKYWAAFKVIAVDLLDATVTILRNFKEMGPYAIAYEAVWRVGMATAWATGVTGANNPQWDITNMPSSPNPPIDYSATAAGFGNTVTIDQLKNNILSATQYATIGSSEFSIPGGGTTFSHNGSYTAELSIFNKKGWKEFKGNFRELVNDGKFWVVADKDLASQWVAPVAGEGSNFVKEFYKTLKTNPKRIVEEVKGSFNKARLKGALKDVGQAAVVQFLKILADEKRANLWSEYLIANAKRENLSRALKAAGKKRRDNQRILEALGLALEQLIKQKEKALEKPSRYLKVLNNDELTGNTDFTMELTFSSNIAVESVTLGKKTITGNEKDAKWDGTFNLVDVGDLEVAQISVNAKGKITQKLLDDPITSARYKTSSKSWGGYEPNTDKYHKVKLKPLRDGTSIVLLFDCSGSMSENDRMKKAIAAGNEVLSSEELKPNDEVAIMGFYDCYDIRVLQSFTTDVDLAKQGLNALLADSGTPLVTAIEQATLYMESAAQTPNRKLIVLTDGEEACNGNEYLGMERIREFKQQVKKMIVR